MTVDGVHCSPSSNVSTHSSICKYRKTKGLDFFRAPGKSVSYCAASPTTQGNVCIKLTEICELSSLFLNNDYATRAKAEYMPRKSSPPDVEDALYSLDRLITSEVRLQIPYLTTEAKLV